MADGKWVLKDEDKDRVDLTFSGSREKRLGDFGGYGDGFGYKSGKCSICGGTTNFVYKDEKGKFF